MNSIDIKRRLATLEAQLFEAIDNIENVSDQELRKIVELIRLHRGRLARGDHGEDSPVRCAICREPIEPRDVVFKRQLAEAEFECRYATDKDRDDAADWRDSLQRQLDELKRIED